MKEQNTARRYKPQTYNEQRNRSRADVQLQQSMDKRFNREMSTTLTRLKAEGRVIIVRKSGRWVGRGFTVLPNPVRRGDGYISWTVR